MALADLLAQHGVSADDRAAVFQFLRSAPLAARSKVEMWEEYVRGRGEQATSSERATLSS